MLTKTHSCRNIKLVCLIDVQLAWKSCINRMLFLTPEYRIKRKINNIDQLLQNNRKHKEEVDWSKLSYQNKIISVIACSKSVWITEIQTIFTRDNSTLEIFQGNSLELKCDETVSSIIFHLQNKKNFIPNSFCPFFSSIIKF